jgi:hypothetical protein
MNRIILDHLRRWWWVWLVIGIANSFICVALVTSGLTSVVTSGPTSTGFSVMLPLILWAGAMQLNFDLQRGMGRTISVLPVTVRQIGRAWWIFSVALPAILLTVTTGLGLMCHSAIGNHAFQLRGFLAISSANTLFLGAMFALFAGDIQSTPQNPAGWLRRFTSSGILIAMMVVFMRGSWNTPAGIFILLLSFILTVVGWFRAEAMVVQRATFRPGIQPGKRKPGQYQVASGFGGLPFLCQTLFIRVGYLGIGVAVWLLVMQVVMHDSMKLSPKQLLEAALPTFSSFGFFFMFLFLLLPLIMQLRHLRSLPISRSALAALLVLLPVAPILLLGLARAIYGMSFPDGTNVFHISANFFTSAAMMAVAAPLFVWQGLRNGSYFLIFFLLMVTSMGLTIFPATKIPESLIVSVSLVVIALAFFATRWLLKSSSRAYRPLPVMMNGLAGYGGGR